MTEQPNMRREALLFLWEIIKVVVISLAIIIPIRYFIVQPFFVRGASMEPSFLNGDYLIIDEISYRFSEPKRGDVVIFRFPQDNRQFFIKRIVALPNETITIEDNEIIIQNEENPSGFVLEEPYVSEGQLTTNSGKARTKLSEHEYFVLGDNRQHSSDSRRWGPIEGKALIGKAIFRAWPLGRFDKFEDVVYAIPN